MSLSYIYPTDGSKPCSKEPLKVERDGVVCGEIRKVKDGHQYFPKGSNKGESVLLTVSAVQNSLTKSQAPRSKGEKKTDQSDDNMDKKVKELSRAVSDCKADLKNVNTALERAAVLLKASLDLLSIQMESKTSVNLLDESINYDDTETDGHTLVEDLTEFLEV